MERKKQPPTLSSLDIQPYREIGQYETKRKNSSHAIFKFPALALVHHLSECFNAPHQRI
jgi:hypothetical protein